MANELYRYTDPDNASLTLTFDSGLEIEGVPVVYDGRDDCKMFAVPLDASGGLVITLRHPDYPTQSHRARFLPNMHGPAGLDMDDFTMVPYIAPPAPPQPEPGPTPPQPASDAPLDIINFVYASGAYNLATHQGCGEFTEACARELAARRSEAQAWGHIKKNPGQNQYEGHAVDAIQCLYGDYHGKWDIITSSVSSSARPAFNDAGDADPKMFYPASQFPA